MEIQQTPQYQLDETDIVTPMANPDGTVTLCCSNDLGTSPGFQIQFTTGHIDALERLLAMLWKEFEAEQESQGKSG